MQSAATYRVSDMQGVKQRKVTRQQTNRYQRKTGSTLREDDDFYKHLESK